MRNGKKAVLLSKALGPGYKFANSSRLKALIIAMEKLESIRKGQLPLSELEYVNEALSGLSVVTAPVNDKERIAMDVSHLFLFELVSDVCAVKESIDCLQREVLIRVEANRINEDQSTIVSDVNQLLSYIDVNVTEYTKLIVRFDSMQTGLCDTTVLLKQLFSKELETLIDTLQSETKAQLCLPTRLQRRMGCNTIDVT